MATSRTTESSTRNPRFRGIDLDPTRAYTRVQVDVPNLGYESPLGRFLDMASPTDPTKAMYQVDSDDSKVTGSSQMRLISCSKADFDAIQKQEDGEALARQRDLTKKGKAEGDIVENTETFTRKRGAIISDI
jgi:hypothetical protein